MIAKVRQLFHIRRSFLGYSLLLTTFKTKNTTKMNYNCICLFRECNLFEICMNVKPFYTPTTVDYKLF